MLICDREFFPASSEAVERLTTSTGARAMGAAADGSLGLRVYRTCYNPNSVSPG